MNAARREEIRAMIAAYKDPTLMDGECPGTLAILDALEECFEALPVEDWELMKQQTPRECARCGGQSARLYCSRRCCPYSYDTVEGACWLCAEPRADHPGAK